MTAHHKPRSPERPGARARVRVRRGVTLVEMMVTVAVLIIIMTVLVRVFQAATAAVSTAQANQELDDTLRRVDSVLRSDLDGATARFTPPLDPADNLGYFEYGENEYADNQGEDCDDYVRFTAKAPAGRPFTGRMWINPAGPNPSNQYLGASAANYSSFPVTVTSDYAEIIYFLRNGNLYRRVFLVAPELQSAIVPAIANTAYSTLPGNLGAQYQFQPSIFGGNTVSWQGVNDLSARPNPTGPNANANPNMLTQAQSTILLNTLGNLTNRENRAFAPRFANDFYNVTTGTYVPDGVPDDINGDSVPDLYPTLYLQVTNAGLFPYNSNYPGILRRYASFPYVYPGAYSRAQTLSTDIYGWIHSPAPVANGYGTALQFDTGGIAYLNAINHNPLDLGDNLPTPLVPTPNVNSSALQQTWWGFPTWRETLSPNWQDPTVQLNTGPNAVASASPAQPLGLTPLQPGDIATLLAYQSGSVALLPAMTSAWRQTAQLFSDGIPTGSLFSALPGGVNPTVPSPLWQSSWEDDLILTNVRSFDVKAYDPTLGTYADLGWGDDLRVYQQYNINVSGVLPTSLFLAGTPLLLPGTLTPMMAWPPVAAGLPSTNWYDTFAQTFAHEGRMPPLTTDNRYDAQYGYAPNYLASTSLGFLPPSGTYNYGNIGDDQRGVARLRRVWDSWSTDYSKAPGRGVNKVMGFPIGPPFGPPVYPSYPAPYPAPLRGIQIQIRVVDPTNQRIKSLTIRQDFSDKL